MVIFTLFGSPAGIGKYTLNIASGVTIGSTSTSTPALRNGGFTTGSEVCIVNDGTVMGRGGAGGAGGSDAGTDTGVAGGTGGDAFNSDDITTDFVNNGSLVAGGGGGPGGGGARDQSISDEPPCSDTRDARHAGGNGGDGAGSQNSGVAVNGTNGTSDAGTCGPEATPCFSMNSGNGGDGGALGTDSGAGTAGNAPQDAEAGAIGVKGNYLVNSTEVSLTNNGTVAGGTTA